MGDPVLQRIFEEGEILCVPPYCMHAPPRIMDAAGVVLFFDDHVAQCMTNRQFPLSTKDRERFANIYTKLTDELANAQDMLAVINAYERAYMYADHMRQNELYNFEETRDDEIDAMFDYVKTTRIVAFTPCCTADADSIVARDSGADARRVMALVEKAKIQVAMGMLTL